MTANCCPKFKALQIKRRSGAKGMATTPAAPEEKKLGLNDKAKAAAKATALTAEKTKLATVSLPNAYAKLGQDCFKANRWATEFPDYYKELGDLATQLVDSTRRSSVDAPSNAGMIDKAKSLAAKGVEAARIQKLKVQMKLGLAKFGKAVFEKYGKEAGPPTFVAPIEPLVERLAKLETEIGDQVTMAGGKKKLLWVSGVAVVVLFFALSFRGKETQLQQDGEIRAGDATTGAPKSPEYTSAEEKQRYLHAAGLASHWKRNIEQNRGPADVWIGQAQETIEGFRSTQETWEQGLSALLRNPDGNEVQIARLQSLIRQEEAAIAGVKSVMGDLVW